MCCQMLGLGGVGADEGAGMLLPVRPLVGVWIVGSFMQLPDYKLDRCCA